MDRLSTITKYGLLGFILITSLYFVALFGGNVTLQTFTKPLVISSLLLLFITSIKKYSSPLFKYIIAALVFYGFSIYKFYK
jgi:hypothetical protein